MKIVGYVLLDAEWEPIAYTAFDEGPARLAPGETVGAVRVTRVEVKISPLGAGLMAVGPGGPYGPFVGTQVAVLREDGTPAGAVDLPEPVVVPEGWFLDVLHVDLQIVGAIAGLRGVS